jgi:glycine cleavage system pyridoxal-binding protein P
MDVSNASVYDGASAAAEGINMCRDRGRTSVYVSASAHPEVIETIRTFSFFFTFQHVEQGTEHLPVRFKKMPKLCPCTVP